MILFTYFKCAVQWYLFSMFTELYDHHHDFRIFSLPHEETWYPLAVTPHFPCKPISPGQPRVFSLSLSVLDVLYIESCMLWSLDHCLHLLSIVLSRHIHMYQNQNVNQNLIQGVFLKQVQICGIIVSGSGSLELKQKILHSLKDDFDQPDLAIWCIKDRKLSLILFSFGHSLNPTPKRKSFWDFSHTFFSFPLPQHIDTDALTPVVYSFHISTLWVQLWFWAGGFILQNVMLFPLRVSE